MMGAYLFAFDFDGTVAQTFKKSPGGIGVEESTTLAIKDVLGEEGLRVYKSNLGGLKNRSLSEIALLLLEESPSLLDNVLQFLDGNRKRLQAYIPEGKGVPLEWKSGNPLDSNLLAEVLVRQKLSHSLPQIGEYENGRIWPEPSNGFLDFWETIKSMESRIETAVISSGHDFFIRKTFSTWQVPPPDILVTEDDIRGRVYPLEIKRRVKPGELPMALAHFRWLRRQGVLPSMSDINEKYTASRARMVYFGDDPYKDGAMAREARISFVQFTASDDWQIVADVLENRRGLFDGRGISEIFAGDVFSSRVERVGLPLERR